MLNDEALLADIDRRLRQFFTEQREGGNGSPAFRYELEGMLRAAVLIGAATEQKLWLRFSSVADDVYGSESVPQYENTWLDGEFPALPVRGQRAPVYPTTKHNDQDSNE